MSFVRFRHYDISQIHDCLNRRRRREREAGASKNKKSKNKSPIDYDKLEARVTSERTLFPREIRDAPAATKKKAEKMLSMKAVKLNKQRTAGGKLDSTRETILPQLPELQAVQISVAKRGNKTVTMVQGMTLPMKDRKVLLKEIKGKLGGGGTLVDGVLECQGSHAQEILAILKLKGYTQAKVVGGKKSK